MARKIPIYKAEIESGLADKIQNSCSVAYITPISIDTNPNKDKILALASIQKAIANFTKAENKNQFDLFYLKDIMVSCGWNLNDDIFAKEELWAARATPEDKPFNLGHDCHAIIGHMTSQYAVNADGTLIDEAIAVDDLPDYFHIVSSAVIYRYWRDKEYMEKMANIIAEIEEGNKWFVSMEALFANYDYAVVAEDGTSAIVPRNENSAFLTKHLRAYGGDGLYKSYKVGRLLRNITFSGKGLVERPANPSSIILNETSPFKVSASQKNYSSLENSGYFTVSDIKSKESKSMATTELELLQKQLDETKSALKAEQAAKADVEKKLHEVDTKSVQAKVEELNKQLSETKAKFDEVLAKYNKSEEDLKKEKELGQKAKAELDEAIKKLAAIGAEQVKQNRILTLADKLGLNKEDATDLAETLADLSDEKFEKYVTKSAMSKEDKQKMMDEEKKKKDAEKAKADANPAVLDTAVANNDAGSPRTPDNTLEQTRANIRNFYEAARGRKDNKAE